MWYLTFTCLLITTCFAFSAFSQAAELQRIDVDGVELYYVEKGSGAPLILLHGGLFDYRSWEPQFEEFAKKYRVISYSRRFSYPNKNSLDAKYRPAITDAEDLRRFLAELGLRRVHLVGLSYGAFTGLIFAVEHPEMVASMVLAEPPAHQLVRDLPDGEAMYQSFLNDLKPMVEAFRLEDDLRAIVIFNQKMGRDFDKLPVPAATLMLQNALALKAINLADEPFPAINKKDLRKLKIPTLIAKGERADRLHASVADEVARLIPGTKSIVVPNSGHNTPRDNPQFFNTAVLEFLDRVKRR